MKAYHFLRYQGRMMDGQIMGKGREGVLLFLWPHPRDVLMYFSRRASWSLYNRCDAAGPHLSHESLPVKDAVWQRGELHARGSWACCSVTEPSKACCGSPLLKGGELGLTGSPWKKRDPATAPLLFCRRYKWWGDPPCRPTPSSAPVGVRALSADPSPTTIPPCSVAWDIFGFGHSLLSILAQVTSCLSQRGDGQQGRDKVKEEQKVSQLLSFRLCNSRQFYTFVSYPFDS